MTHHFLRWTDNDVLALGKRMGALRNREMFRIWADVINMHPDDPLTDDELDTIEKEIAAAEARQAAAT